MKESGAREPRPLEVLHVITELSVGGAQQALLNYVREADRTRFHITVACFYNADGLLARALRAEGISVIDLGMKSKWRPARGLWRLYRLMKERRPDVLHTWLFHENIAGRLIGNLAGVRVVVSSERTMGQQSRFRLLLDRVTAPWTDAVLCVSEEVGRFARQRIGIPSEKTVVIPNGIGLGEYEAEPDRGEARRLLDLPPEKLVIGAAGRARPVKGYPFLLKAYADLAERFGPPRPLLIFIGEGPDTPMLREEARRLGISESVRFYADRRDIPRVLPAMDILVLPSLWEGMPVVAIEGQAAGVPVVATRVGGTPEVVVDGDTGLLVERGDVEAMAEALERLLRNEALREKMGRNGRRRVFERFDARRMAREFEDLYMSRLGEKGAGV